MKKVTLNITVTEEDLDTLKGIMITDDKSGIINHIISLATEKIKEPLKELSMFQNVLLKGLLKLNDIPLNIFNFEYQSDIAELEKIGVISFTDLDNLKIIHLNFDYDNEHNESIDTIYEILKKQFNLK